MKILFSGDSFTYGDELENRDEERYSRLVCEHFNAEELNTAACGNCNDAILSEIFLPGRPADVVVTQWSIPSRFQTTFDDGKTYRSILPENATPNKYNHNDDFKVQHRARSHYRDVQSDCMDSVRMWRNIMMTQIFCEAKNMTHINIGLNKHYEYPETNVFQDMAQVSLKYIVPDIIGEMRNKDNFCPDLTHIDPYKHGNHPNANGHRLIANYVIEQINATME
tara:strand:- start:4011 stop:4679 length:669 start_codon:yes stop_codon:yes gene_type:complete